MAERLRMLMGSLGFRSFHSRRLSTIPRALDNVTSRIAVLHGSHSGNSERYSHHLQAELRWRLGADVVYGNIADFDPRSFSELRRTDIVLLLVSTYGDGGPNKNTEPFWNYVFSNESPALSFSYSILSRGSSLYEGNFSRAGKELDKRLETLGAHRIAPLGIQDKIGTSPEDEYFEWQEQVVSALKEVRGYTELPFIYHPPDIRMEEVPHSENLALDNELPVPAPTEVKLLAKTDREYLYAEAAITSGYKTGDYIVLWPENSGSKVALFLDALFGESPRKHSSLKIEGVGTFSYDQLARHVIDINGQVERGLLSKLVHFAPTQDAKAQAVKLLESRSTLPGLADLLKQLSPSTPWITTLPIAALFDVLPRLTARRYSISTSSLESPHRAGLTAVVERDDATNFTGVATGQLRSLIGKADAATTVSIEAVRGFRPPPPDVPVLLFGLGTGVAPYRGFVRERYLRPSEAARTVLFAGARTPGDLVHHDEFKQLEADPKFDFTVIPAYSRIADGPEKGHIGEKIAEHAEAIYDMIESGAHVYICGDVRKVRRTVRNGIAEILARYRGLPAENGQGEFKKLKKAGKVHTELW